MRCQKCNRSLIDVEILQCDSDGWCSYCLKNEATLNESRARRGLAPWPRDREKQGLDGFLKACTALGSPPSASNLPLLGFDWNLGKKKKSLTEEDKEFLASMNVRWE
jgi:hypothetical protein